MSSLNSQEKQNFFDLHFDKDSYFPLVIFGVNGGLLTVLLKEIYRSHLPTKLLSHPLFADKFRNLFIKPLFLEHYFLKGCNTPETFILLSSVIFDILCFCFSLLSSNFFVPKAFMEI